MGQGLLDPSTCDHLCIQWASWPARPGQAGPGQARLAHPAQLGRASQPGRSGQPRMVASYMQRGPCSGALTQGVCKGFYPLDKLLCQKPQQAQAPPLLAPRCRRDAVSLSHVYGFSNNISCRRVKVDSRHEGWKDASSALMPPGTLGLSSLANANAAFVGSV